MQEWAWRRCRIARALHAFRYVVVFIRFAVLVHTGLSCWVHCAVVVRAQDLNKAMVHIGHSAQMGQVDCHCHDTQLDCCRPLIHN